MSKTSEGNWVKETLGLYWRRFAALATAWLRKYQDDPFFRTEVNAIALQIAFAIFMVGVVGASFSLLNKDVSTAIEAGIQTSIETSNTTEVAPTIVNQIQTIRAQNLAVVISLIAVATAIFGYIIARVTLAPTRNALAAQKQFIGNIAHEVRTPLAIIKANSEIALLQNKISTDTKEMLISNVEELDRISEIINNLLSLNALINPEKMEFQSLDLSHLADEVAIKYARLAAVGRHKVTVEGSPGTRVQGNATALEQVIGNLLRNALMYTPQRGTIVISVNPTESNQVEMSVRDSGMGIARKDLDRIFEPFYRAEQSRTRAKGGSGLGLTIASELVKMHGGKIAIRSTIGVGTTVTATFPASEHQPEAAAGRKKTTHDVVMDLSTQKA